jgi:hypothetical protein
MTTDHFFYIPIILMLGFIAGLLLGRRAGANTVLAEQEKEARRKARRAAREAKKDSSQESDSSNDAPVS